MSHSARMTGLGVPSTWSRTPWFLTTPPEAHAATIERPKLVAAIDDAVSTHAVVAVGAPSGYGKSTAVAQWARSTSLPTAWLSLTRFDADPRRVTDGVLAALQHVIDVDVFAAASALDPSALAPIVDHIAGALADRGERVALVVDQVEHLERARDTILGALAVTQPRGLALVVVGTASAPDLLRELGGPRGAARFGSEELALSREDVIAAADLLPVGRIDMHTAGAIIARTGGWPIAVRLALLGREQPLDRDLGDYIEDAILSDLPADLAGFVRAAVTVARLDAPLARAVTGRDDAGAMLAECVRRGLFLDRFTRDGSRLHVWHTAFRDAVLTAEQDRDPVAFRARNIAAAAAVRAHDPLEAVAHFVAAGDPDAAYDVVLDTWLELLQEGQSHGLGLACASLPAAYADRPAMLNVRACCAWLASDPGRARVLAARATSATDRTPREAAVSALSSILVSDDPDVMRAGVARAREIAGRAGALSGRTLAYALYITGYSELRLREEPARVIANLTSALRECEAQGLTRMASRVAATLGFACAFAGRFTRALECVERAQAYDPSDDEWQVYDAGAVAVTRGFVAYWRNDLAGARDAFAPLVQSGRGGAAYGPVAFMYDALAAAGSSDRAWQVEALARLREMPNETILGVPWRAFRSSAMSELTAILGRMSDAVALAEGALAPGVPVPRALAAEMFRRAGQSARARHVIVDTNAAELTVPARVAMLLTDALLRREAGRPDAHAALERALALAEPEGIVRPFVASPPEIGDLLEAHRGWGTEHGAFVAFCLSQRTPAQNEPGYGLSRRESEILSYLRTTMTLAEIASTLFVSHNTVKTHVRSIYRKLGVSSRREAVRIHP